MSFTESYSGLVPKRPFYEELVRDGGLVRSYIQTSTSLDPSTSSTPSTTSSIPSTTSSTPSTSQIGQAGMVIPSAISTPVFMHGLRRARTKRAQERREALSREAAAGVAAAGKARGINNNKIDTMDTIREQLARDYPEPIWPTGRDTKWQFQVNKATEAQKQAKKISERGPNFKQNKLTHNEAAQQVTLYIGPYRVDGKVAKRYNTRTSNGLSDPDLVTRAIELYKRRLFLLVQTKQCDYSVAADRQRVMNDASDMAAREARARTRQPDDNVGTFRRWIGITVMKNHQGIWCVKCHLPTGSHWKDGEQTVSLSLGRWNGTPAPPFNSATSWLNFGFNCNWLDNYAVQHPNDLNSQSKTETGLTHAEMKTAINVFKQLVNQTFHLINDPTFTTHWKTLRDRYYKAVSRPPFCLLGPELCYRTTIVDQGEEKDAIYRTGVAVPAAIDDTIGDHFVMTTADRKRALKLKAMDTIRQTGNVVLAVEAASSWVKDMTSIAWIDYDYTPPSACAHPGKDETHVCPDCDTIVSCATFDKGCCTGVRSSGRRTNFETSFSRAAYRVREIQGNDFRPPHSNDQKAFERRIGRGDDDSLIPCRLFSTNLDPHDRNPLLRPTVTQLLPVAAIFDNESRSTKVCLLHPDNAAVVPMGLARMRWFYPLHVPLDQLDHTVDGDTATRVQRDVDIATRVQRLERTFTHLTIPFTVKKRAAMSPNEVVEAMSPLIDDMERYIPAPAGLVRVGRATVSPAPATSAKVPRRSRRLTEAEAAHAAQVQTLDGELQEAAGIEPEAVQGDPKLVNPFLCDPPLSYLATKGLWMERVIRLEDFCNWEHPTDEAVSWVTLRATMLYQILQRKSGNTVDQLPMTNRGRHPLRGSVGHIIHHKNMSVGWTTSNPVSLAEFRPRQVNVVLELWTINAMKSDADDRHISEFLDFVKKHWKKIAKANEERASEGGVRKTNDAKANDAKANDAKANDAKANDAKANDAKANDAKANEEKVRKTKDRKANEGGVHKANEEKASEEKASEEKANEEKASEGEFHKTNDGKRKHESPTKAPRKKVIPVDVIVIDDSDDD